jgi:hypothetical protein
VKKERLLQKLGKKMGKPNTTLPSDVFALIDEALSDNTLGHKQKKSLQNVYMSETVSEKTCKCEATNDR